MVYSKIKNKEACNGLLLCPLGYAKFPGISQTLVLLWRYFVDMIKVHNQLTLSKGDYSR